MRAHDFSPKKTKAKKPVRWHFDQEAIVFFGGVACKCVGSNRRGYILSPDREGASSNIDHDAVVKRGAGKKR
jgi:hypothetical protein